MRRTKDLFARSLFSPLLFLFIIVAVLGETGGCAETHCVISPAAKSLLQVLNSMDVGHRWLPNRHVNWETGLPDRSPDYRGPGRKTHCSAFAAAVGKRLGIYLLRPPEHSQVLLASAQAQWLAGGQGGTVGCWHAVRNAQAAQDLANNGKLVVIVYQSPHPQKPGHIAIVRPSCKSPVSFLKDGPQVTQAGKYNRVDWDARHAFSAHPNAWPDGVRYYMHELNH